MSKKTVLLAIWLALGVTALSGAYAVSFLTSAPAHAENGG
jgi:hypothetical protein